MTPKFIYFDLGNVLLNFSHELACRQMAEVSGTSPDVVRRVLFESGLDERYDTGQITTAEFCEAFCRETNTRPDLASLKLAAGAIFEVNVPVKPIVTQLLAAGHRLGILSNTCEVHWDYLSNGRYSLIPDAFEAVVLSYEVGALKPHEAIYRRAAELAGVAPSEIFFVDDRPENVAGAQAVGFDAVPYTTASQLAADLRRRGVTFNY